ncbi:hypothetical protein R3P38DRAFT_1964519 [Favolaschia claudopus]|uniref:Secreted protein n=1 Tax=Favolaschia claudopus TaxID=2862362 RepID=A0AAV9ZZN5_9AGAR
MPWLRCCAFTTSRGFFLSVNLRALGLAQSDSVLAAPLGLLRPFLRRRIGFILKVAPFIMSGVPVTLQPQIAVDFSHYIFSSRALHSIVLHCTYFVPSNTRVHQVLCATLPRQF